jgi:hypothetical protein
MKIPTGRTTNMSRKKTKIRFGTRAAARAVNRSPSSVSSYVRHPAWTFGTGPWTAAQVKLFPAWIEKHMTTGRGDPELRAARVELLNEELLRLNVLNAIDAGQFVVMATVGHMAIQAAVEMRQHLLAMPSTLASGNPRCTEDELRDVIAERAKWIADSLAEAMQKIPGTAGAERYEDDERRRSEGAKGARNAGPRRKGAARPYAKRIASRKKR